MADDTRDPQPQDQANDGQETRRPRRPRPKHDFPETQAGKLWKAFGNPDNPVNEMPGGMVNTAGGRPKEVTWRDAFNVSEIASKGTSFYRTPCARDSLLVGIGSGGAVGGLGFILRGVSRSWITANYAVGTFAIASLGMYTWCQSRRREEAKGMALAVAGMKMLHEKKAREEAEEKAKASEAAQKLKEEDKNKPWYKVW